MDSVSGIFAFAAALREFQFALVPAQAGGAGGRDRHRQAGGLAEQRGGDAAAGDIDQRAMAQLDALERRAVVGDGDVVLGGAIDELEHALRQPPLRRRAQVVDVQAAIEVGPSHALSQSGLVHHHVAQPVALPAAEEDVGA